MGTGKGDKKIGTEEKEPAYSTNETDRTRPDQVVTVTMTLVHL